jgi:integral membrane sensor domain MASE1
MAGIPRAVARRLGARDDVVARLVPLVALTAAYYVVGRLSLDLSLVGKSVTPLWGPTGLALVEIFLVGYRVWPAITVAAFLVNLPISPSPEVALGIAVGNTLAPLAAAWLLRTVRFDRHLARPRDALALVVAGTAATTLSASGGTSLLVLSGAVPSMHFGSTWLVWWTGDAMGMLLVAPFVWSLRPGLVEWTWLRLLEAVGLGAVLLATLVIATTRAEPGLFVVLPPLVWIAWRFHQQGAAPAGLLTSILMTEAAVHGDGRFAHLSLASAMVTLQSFNATVALVGLFAAAAISDRARVLGRLRQIVDVAQEAVIRPPAPFVGPLALAARYESASDEARIGGDLYEVADTPFGVRLVIGDVRGKGLPAVQAASAALRAFRRSAYSVPDLAGLVGEVIEQTDRALEQDDEFITALFAEIASTGELRLANLGHPAPLHLRGRSVEALEPSRRAAPLGLARTRRAAVDRFDFEPGDRLLLFTDGLAEGRDRSGAFFPLAEAAAELLGGQDDLETGLDALMTRFLSHVDAKVTDDIAVLLAAWVPLRVRAPEPVPLGPGS